MKKNLIILLLGIATCVAVAVGIWYSIDLGRHRHEYAQAITAPNCTERGYTTYTCDCGESYESDYKDPLGHDFAEGFCSKCGTEHNHNYIYGQCGICGVEHEHDYDQTVTEPTCTEAGFVNFSCEPCGYSYTQISVDPLGHDFADGICSRCGKNEYSIGLSFTLSEDGSYYICDGRGTATDTDIVIPSTYEGKPVSAISYYFISNLKHVCTSVTIPESVASVGWRDNIFGVVEPIVNSILTVYCEAESQPEGWESGWNRGCPVVWNCKNNDVAEDGYIYTAVGGIRYMIKDGSATVAKQSSNISGNIVIPKSIRYKGGDYPVTAICESAFFWCRSLTGLILPDSVTAIGYMAFGNCSNLETIALGNGLTTIGQSAFMSCNNLTNVHLPAGLTAIGDGAFRGCNSLKSLTIEKGNVKYHSEGNCIIETESKTLIRGCKNSIIPNDGSVIAIGEGAFSSSGQMTSIKIPEAVTRIEKNAFDGNCLTVYCEAESQPEGWESGWNGGCPVVWDCKNNDVAEDGYVYTVIGGIRYMIKDGIAIVARQPLDISGIIVIPEYVQYKGRIYFVISVVANACFGNSKITGLIVPDSVQFIGKQSFYYGKELTSVTIGKNVTYIGDEAFAACSNLTEITFKGTIEQWNAIDKGYRWHSTSGLIIHCTDGDTEKN